MVLTVTCKKCNKKVPTNEVRLQPDKSHICFACAGYGVSSRPGANTPFQAKSEDLPRQKVQFQCQKCKYTFFIKTGAAMRCPYCNGTNLEEKKGIAQKMLDMDVSFRDDMSGR